MTALWYAPSDNDPFQDPLGDTVSSLGHPGTLNRSGAEDEAEGKSVDSDKIKELELLTVYVLEQLHKLEGNLILVYNKLSNIEYTTGKVNLSKHQLSQGEHYLLPKRKAFCITSGSPGIVNIFHNLKDFKRKVRLLSGAI